MSEKLLNQIDFYIACAFEFARTKSLSAPKAFSYLAEYKGFDFLETHFEAEHLLSFEDAVDDLTVVCRKNGGELE